MGSEIPKADQEKIKNDKIRKKKQALRQYREAKNFREISETDGYKVLLKSIKQKSQHPHPSNFSKKSKNMAEEQDELDKLGSFKEQSEKGSNMMGVSKISQKKPEYREQPAHLNPHHHPLPRTYSIEIPSQIESHGLTQQYLDQVIIKSKKADEYEKNLNNIEQFVQELNTIFTVHHGSQEMLESKITQYEMKDRFLGTKLIPAFKQLFRNITKCTEQNLVDSFLQVLDEEQSLNEDEKQSLPNDKSTVKKKIIDKNKKIQEQDEDLKIQEQFVKSTNRFNAKSVYEIQKLKRENQRLSAYEKKYSIFQSKLHQTFIDRASQTIIQIQEQHIDKS